jgi:acetyl-CoA carboxylase carboxyl transferase subunit beta
MTYRGPYKVQLADKIVPELPDAADEPGAFCRRLGAAIERQLDDLVRLETARRLGERRARYAVR